MDPGNGRFGAIEWNEAKNLDVRVVVVKKSSVRRIPSITPVRALARSLAVSAFTTVRQQNCTRN